MSGNLSSSREIFSPVARNSFARRCQFSRASPLGPGRRDPIEATVPGCTAASRSQGKKEAARRKKEAARGGKKIVARGEESFRGNLLRRGDYGHDKEYKIIRISKLPSHCVYAKMPSLVHQMPSLSKCISQMQNCWRAIFKIFGKFQECKV